MTMNNADNCFDGAELVNKPFLSNKMASELLVRLYGLEAKCLRELPSYCDQNFYARAPAAGEKRDGPRADSEFVLKVISGDDSLGQAGSYGEIVTVLLSLRGDDGVAYPLPVTNLHGGYLSLQRFHREPDGARGLFLVLLLSYVPGTILSEVKLSNEVLYGVGRAVARLNKKLLDLKGPFEHLKERAETNMWCLTSVADVEQYIDGVPDTDHRLLAKSVLDRFVRDVKPIENTMQKGLIHVDMNRANILVAPNREPTNREHCSNDVTRTIRQSASHVVTGIIDFNDMACECLVYDVAGSLADMMVGKRGQQPLVAGGYFLAGYSSVIQLTRTERQSLYVATAARLAQLLVLSQEYFRRSGYSDEYIMRIERAGGWQLLKELWDTPQRKVEALWEELTLNNS
ncbi:hydroxylysine kinase-like [Patiria miniata]|uniref:Hydroxylysine kinase n=1 Tax=Patiria miniata TaxID=46514 RepID=A0A913ZCE1_PATMI|nr:hydroxylysine kinase-like [Patiria miniata]